MGEKSRTAGGARIGKKNDSLCNAGVSLRPPETLKRKREGKWKEDFVRFICTPRRYAKIESFLWLVDDIVKERGGGAPYEIDQRAREIFATRNTQQLTLSTLERMRTETVRKIDNRCSVYF